MTNGYNTPIGVPIGLPSILSLGLPPLVNPYPTLNLDFINNPQFDSRITFSRGSQATLFNSTGTLVYAKQNVLLQSQDFSTTWSVASQNASITTNTAVAPDGTTTADTITDDATSGIHRVSQSVTTSSTTQLVFSVFAKYSTMQWIGLSAATATSAWAGAKFDIQNGVLGSTSQQGTGWAANSSSITPVGNGWYRCVLVFTPGATGATTFLVNCATDGTTFTASQRGSELYSGTGSSAFIWGAQLNTTPMEGGVTSSLTTYYPTTTAAYYAPRFDYNPSTLQPRGLLIEEQRTNIAYPSNMPTSTVQTTTGTMQANGATQITSGVLAPDASTSGFTVSGASATTNSSGANNIRIFAITSAVTYTVSMWIKSNGSSTTVTVRDASTSTASNRTTTSDWTRQSFTFTSTGASNIIILSTGGAAFDCFGVQVEVGAFATSYIPTTTTALTRNADVASMTGTNFSSWYNASEGTLFAIGSVQRGFREIVGVSEGVGNDRIVIQTGSSSGQRIIVTTLGVQQALQSGSYTLGQTGKFAAAYATNSAIISVNGGISTEGTSVTVPTVTTLNIGNTSNSTGQISGYIQRIAYYPTRLPNATLQALTA